MAYTAYIWYAGYAQYINHAKYTGYEKNIQDMIYNIQHTAYIECRLY